MKTLIIGNGEIGKSILGVLDEHYPCDIIDKEGEDTTTTYEIIHICFPYSDKFVEHVKEYQEKYKPEFTVIHSTVPVGTSRKVNGIHSPVEGLHPFLKESIQTFTKFLSGPDAGGVADYFRRANIIVYLIDNQESTEYMKIMSTTFYGMMIELTKQVKIDCMELDIPFELFTLWNMNYNEAYKKLGHPEYMKPLLVPIMHKISGHCVMQNTELLKNDFTDFLKMRNKNE